MLPKPTDPGREFLIACLCAEWCGTCREYRDGFFALASAFPQMGFTWIDVEDHSEQAGDIDAENFPTLLVERDDAVLFLGTVLPDHGVLRRLLETFSAQTPEESRQYALATAERRDWQQYELRARLK